MIFFLPGLGATSKMYGPVWRTLGDVRAIDWPHDSGIQTIDGVAEWVIDSFNIGAVDVLIGSSLGGIVALRVHEKQDVSSVILLGSAVDRSEINVILRHLAPLAHFTPLRLVQFLSGKSEALLPTMFSQVDTDFIRSMCVSINHWHGFSGSKERIHRVHGENDQVISCPQDAHRIQGGGHLIAMTHAESCVEIVRQLLSESENSK